MEPIYFTSQAEFRDWLHEHHATATELWIGFYKKGASQSGITYPEAVDEAICFGWIDGIRKSVDGERYVNRFTPRKPHSIWSQVNLKKVEELSAAGRMQPAGLKACEERDRSKENSYSFEQGDLAFPEDYEAQFRANTKAWDYFQAKGASYRKAAIWWVISAKQEATQLKRLQTLISDSEQGRTVPPLTPRKGAKGKAE